MSTPQPCPQCGKNRWKTLKKGKRWMCRTTQTKLVLGRIATLIKCGHVRQAV